MDLSFGTGKNLKGLKKDKPLDNEAMVLRMEITYNKIECVLELLFIVPSLQFFELPPSVFETTEPNTSLKTLLTVNIDEFGLKVRLSVQCDENEFSSLILILFLIHRWKSILTGNSLAPLELIQFFDE